MLANNYLVAMEASDTTLHLASTDIGKATALRYLQKHAAK